jgi:hypothetical protein
MSRRHLQPRERRALVLGMAVVLPALLFVLVVSPYMGSTAGVREQLRAQHALLQQELALLDEPARYPPVLERADSAIHAAVPRLFGGDDGVTATAALAAYVADHARRSRVLVQRTDGGTPAAVVPGVLRLSLELRALGDLEGLMTLFHALEHGPKLVRIESFSIEPARPGAPDEDAPLALAAVLAGYVMVAPELAREEP